MTKKKQTSTVISIMTTCAVCNKTITKKNKRCEDLYVCDECNKLNDDEIEASIFLDTIAPANEEGMITLTDEIYNQIIDYIMNDKDHHDLDPKK
jgi:hypothetical protein